MVTAEAKPEIDLDAPLANEFGFECIQLRLPAEWQVTEAAFLELCELNEGWNFETTANGELVIMPGTGRENSKREAEILIDVGTWARSGGGGELHPGDGMARLPDGVMRSADVAWISPERVDEQQEGYDGQLIPICPDFVVEVRSRSDSVRRQQEKMEQWMAYGARLGWLIDAYNEKVWIYRAGGEEPEELERPDQLGGEDVLPGLVVEMGRIWD